jgi:hypothetical protein
MMRSLEEFVLMVDVMMGGDLNGHSISPSFSIGIGYEESLLWMILVWGGICFSWPYSKLLKRFNE